tara:strand:- start:344 stop:748 length:405 start_codon:yes stop_codon:yes gene_type:complete
MKKINKTTSPTRSRDKVLQTLYEMEIGEKELKQVLQNHSSEKSNLLYKEILNGVIESKEKIDEMVFKHSNRPVEKLDFIERNAIRIAIYELINKKVDPAVSINEAIRMSKKYGSSEGYKLVNAVLDSIVKESHS